MTKRRMYSIVNISANVRDIFQKRDTPKMINYQHGLMKITFMVIELANKQWRREGAGGGARKAE